jgi:hypothetical protein
MVQTINAPNRAAKEGVPNVLTRAAIAKDLLWAIAILTMAHVVGRAISLARDRDDARSLMAAMVPRILNLAVMAMEKNAADRHGLARVITKNLTAAPSGLDLAIAATEKNEADQNNSAPRIVEHSKAVRSASVHVARAAMTSAVGRSNLAPGIMRDSKAVRNISALVATAAVKSVVARNNSAPGIMKASNADRNISALVARAVEKKAVDRNDLVPGAVKASRVVMSISALAVRNSLAPAILTAFKAVPDISARMREDSNLSARVRGILVPAVKIISEDIAAPSVLDSIRDTRCAAFITTGNSEAFNRNAGDRIILAVNAEGLKAMLNAKATLARNGVEDLKAPDHSISAPAPAANFAAKAVSRSVRRPPITKGCAATTAKWKTAARAMDFEAMTVRWNMSVQAITNAAVMKTDPSMDAPDEIANHMVARTPETDLSF